MDDSPLKHGKPSAHHPGQLPARHGRNISHDIDHNNSPSLSLSQEISQQFKQVDVLQQLLGLKTNKSPVASNILSKVGNISDISNLSAAYSAISTNANLTFNTSSTVYSSTRISSNIHTEATIIIGHLKNPYRLIAALMVGSSLSLPEALRLRISDIDFHTSRITIRDTKGDKYRTAVLNPHTALPLKKQVGLARCLHDKDISDGYGRTVLPGSLARQQGLVSGEFAWQLVFASGNRSIDPRSGIISRQHVDEQSIYKATHSAVDTYVTQQHVTKLQKHKLRTA